MIEIFSDRIEVTNPGSPLIDPLRFIDQPPRSRNERLASFLRRIDICEERGSGVDKIVTAAELFQLPAPEFVEFEDDMRVTLLSTPPPLSSQMSIRRRNDASFSLRDLGGWSINLRGSING